MTGVNQTALQLQTATDTLGGWQQTLLFDQFDPSLGTLVGVDVGVVPNVTSSISIADLDGAATPISADVSDGATVTGPGNSFLVSAALDVENVGTVAPGGTSNIFLTGSTAVAFSQPPSGIDAAAFIGDGTVPLTVLGASELSVTGSANMQVSSRTSSGAAVSMQYSYVPPASGGGGDGVDMTLAPEWNGPWIQTPDAIITTTPQSFSFSDNQADWNDVLPVVQFDATLGTLEAINLTLTGTMSASVSATNEDTETSPIMTSQTVAVSLGSLLSAVPVVNDWHSLASGAAFSDSGLQGEAWNSTELTDTADLAAFTGQGTVALPMTASGTGTVDGPGYMLATLLAQSGATVTVSYSYLPNGVAADSIAWWSMNGGNWSDGDWTSGTNAPLSTDDVAITNQGTYTIAIDQAQTVRSLIVDSPDATVLLDADLTTTGNVILDAGTIEFNGGTLSVDNLTINGGTIAGGTVDIEAAGSVDVNGGSVAATDVLESTANGVPPPFALQTATLSADLGDSVFGGAGDLLRIDAGMQFANHADALSGAFAAPDTGGTITAGSMHDLIMFASGAARVSDIIEDFLPGQDHIGLSNYGLGIVPAVLQSVVAGPGGTTVTLPDGTSITIAGIEQLRASDIIAG